MRSAAQLQQLNRNVAAGVPAPEALDRIRVMGTAGVTMRELGRGMHALADAVTKAGAAFAKALRLPRYELVVEDPATWRPVSLRGVLAQMRAIVLHDFWTAAARPERSPGARYVLRSRSR